MANRERANGTCSQCTGSIFSLGLTALFLWLGFGTFSPKFSIEMFEVPALNTTSSSKGNSKIIDPTFDLRLKNENLNEGVLYDTINVTLYYYQLNISTFVPIGNVSIPAFYQGYGKKAHRVESIPSYGVPWEIAKMEILNGSTAMFRVDLDTKIRYKYPLWKSKRHTIMGLRVKF
ncbi:protein NDR1-like [Papaver somniferum]|uniref:protein NDR1-like n=1 Tax=Papaver somniferum TaxID=3469 RepID=UPI000E6FA5D7|nr:protein NDR1-like [Papaver somniferum]